MTFSTIFWTQPCLKPSLQLHQKPVTTEWPSHSNIHFFSLCSDLPDNGSDVSLASISNHRSFDSPLSDVDFSSSSSCLNSQQPISFLVSLLVSLSKPFSIFCLNALPHPDVHYTNLPHSIYTTTLISTIPHTYPWRSKTRKALEKLNKWSEKVFHLSDDLLAECGAI